MFRILAEGGTSGFVFTVRELDSGRFSLSCSWWYVTEVFVVDFGTISQGGTVNLSRVFLSWPGEVGFSCWNFFSLDRKSALVLLILLEGGAGHVR